MVFHFTLYFTLPSDKIEIKIPKLNNPTSNYRCRFPFFSKSIVLKKKKKNNIQFYQ